MAFRRAGVLRVSRIAELFYLAEVLSKQPRPKGNRLSIVTNAGGPGVLATDELITSGGELTELSPKAIQAYDQLLPDAWSHNNPIDILGDASPERYAKSLQIAAQDENSDGMLVILTPQDMTDPTRTAEELVFATADINKPLLASWMGGSGVVEGEMILNRANIPAFPYPDTAARMFSYMANYTAILKRMYETPVLISESDDAPKTSKATEIIQNVRKSGRTILTEFESKQLLANYGIPTVETRIAKDADTAVQVSREIGYPVVLKLHSETITHKTDVEGVQLNLVDEIEVRDAFERIKENVTTLVGEVSEHGIPHFLGVTVQPMIDLEGFELILGSSIDPQFGPVLLFGMGGTLVEVFKDSSLALPPLNSTLAGRMMETTKIYQALKGVRGREGVNLEALEKTLIRFSQLIAEQRWIEEFDINPLIASPDGVLALDARVLVFGSDLDEEDLPQLAIRPYPTQYVSEWTARDGSKIIFRPIRAEDELEIVKFHETLSDRSVFLRYMHPMILDDRAAHERLSRICHCDYDREITLVIEKVDAGEKELKILGALRITKLHGTNAARFSLLISDKSQGKGLGSELMRRLIPIARQEKLDRLEAIMTPDNRIMQGLCSKLGFSFSKTDDGMVRAEIFLN